MDERLYYVMGGLEIGNYMTYICIRKGAIDAPDYYSQKPPLYLAGNNQPSYTLHPAMMVKLSPAMVRLRDYMPVLSKRSALKRLIWLIKRERTKVVVVTPFIPKKQKGDILLMQPQNDRPKPV